MDAVLGGQVRQRLLLLQELLNQLSLEGRRVVFPHHGVQSILFQAASLSKFLALPRVWCTVCACYQGAGAFWVRTRRRKRGHPARPYICRLIVLSRLTFPATRP